jgi:hypothetical protein
MALLGVADMTGGMMAILVGDLLGEGGWMLVVFGGGGFVYYGSGFT